MTFDALRRRRRGLLFAAVVLTAAGVGASAAMPTALFPRISFPRLQVRVDAGDLPAEWTMAQVTRPLELALRGVPDLVKLRSTTSRGGAEVSAHFRWGTDMIQAELLATKELERVRGELPAGTAIDLRRMDSTVFPVIGVSLTSDARTSPTALRDLAELDVLPALSRIAGVARVSVLGGALREVWVELLPERLAAHGLRPDDVTAALARENVLRAVGKLTERHRLDLVVADAVVDAPAVLAELPVAGAGAAVVRLKQVARVLPGERPRWTRVTADGRDAVLLNVHQQLGADTVAIAAALRGVLEQARPRLPAGVTMAVFYDPSDLILESMASVRDAILVGVLLATVVILVFLRSARLTLIAAASVVCSVATTVLCLWGAGLGFDIMTLGAIAAAISLVIDDAIVVVEHVAAVLARGGPRSDAVGRALEELGPSLPGSSLGTMIVFVPLAFLDGVTGAFFRPLALTMVVVLGVSFVSSVVLVPLLADRHLTTAPATKAEGRVLAWCERVYARLVRLTLRAPWLVVLGALALVPAALWAYGGLETGFLPEMDEGGFVLDYRSPDGTSLEETDRLLRQVEAILEDTPEVAAYSRRTGLQLSGALSEANEGDFLVRLTRAPRRSAAEVIDDIRERVEGQVKGLEVEFAALMGDLIGDLTAVPQPIEVKLFGDDPAQLRRLAPGVAARLEAVPGVVDVVPGIVVAGDSVSIRLDHERLGLHGLTAHDVATTLEQAVGGAVATTLVQGERVVGVRTIFPRGARERAADLAAITLRAPDGALVPLGDVARLEPREGEAQLTREDLRPMVAVTARLDGRDLGGGMADVQRAVGALPPGVEVAYGGLYEEQQRSFRGLALVIGVGALLVTLVLVFLFDSYAAAAAIVLVAALSLAGVFVGLRATGEALNVSSLVGMVMIIGIVAESAVFLVHEARRQVEAGVAVTEALVTSGRVRMRQVVMTTACGVLALLPLALGVGAGSQMQRPLAVAVIGGFAFKTLLLLLVLPAALAAFGFGRRPAAGP